MKIKSVLFFTTNHRCSRVNHSHLQAPSFFRFDSSSSFPGSFSSYLHSPSFLCRRMGMRWDLLYFLEISLLPIGRNLESQSTHRWERWEQLLWKQWKWEKWMKVIFKKLDQSFSIINKHTNLLGILLNWIFWDWELRFGISNKLPVKLMLVVHGPLFATVSRSWAVIFMKAHFPWSFWKTRKN